MIVEAMDPGPGRSWPKIGERLVVLEVEVSVGKEPLYRIERDPGTPVLVPASDVKILDGSLPADWAVGFDVRSGTFLLGPSVWQSLGFWERFFDFDPMARQHYDAHRRSFDAGDG